MFAKRGMALLLCLAGLGVCLAGAGCHIQVVRNDPVPTPPSQPVVQPSPQGVVQANYNGPPLAQPPHNGVIVGHPPHNNHLVYPVPGPGVAPPGAPGGPPLAPEKGDVPHELAMRSHPPYTIEPPDILLIDTIRLIPRPPYTLGVGDLLRIRATAALPDQPIPALGLRGEEMGYQVDPDGYVDLGFSYGRVRVLGMTVQEAARAIRIVLRRHIEAKPPVEVFVSLAEFRGIQQARGEHLVRQDGTISLGGYGCVYVTGLTLAQAKVAIERHLSQFFIDPEITVDVFAYNSKYYYVITDGAGFGMQVFRFPITGKETVLDAINNIGGIPAINSLRKIWVARPAPADAGCTQILPVDWLAIAQGGATGTNYQLFPGDRVYVASNPLIKLDNVMSIAFAPIERLLGITLLTQSIFSRGGGGGGNGGVGFIAPLR